MNYLSIDLSKRSPGVTLYNDGKYYIYFFNHRKKLKKFKYKKDNIVIKGIDFFDYKKLNRFEIYNFITNNIKNVIKKSNETIILLEQYAFGEENSRGFTDLCELKGVLVHELLKNKNIKDIQEIAIGTWKKWFTGNGCSKKLEIYDICCREVLDFNKVLNLTFSKNGTLKTPVDDMCDSIGILYYGIKKKVKSKNLIDNILDNF